MITPDKYHRLASELFFSAVDLVLFQLLLYQMCFSGLCLHNLFCYVAHTLNTTQKLELNITKETGM